MNKKTDTAKAKQAKLEPIEATIVEKSSRIEMLLKIKDVKIPFYDKLPKDNQFYKFYMQNLRLAKMRDVTQGKIDEDRMMFDNAGIKLAEDARQAERSFSPRKGKMKVYE